MKVSILAISGIIGRAKYDLNQKRSQSMPTSPLYDSIYARLQQSLSDSLPSQNESLAASVVGAALSQSCHLGRIAQSMPIDGKQESKKQRLRRLLDNERVTPGTHYQPIVQAALTGLKNQRVDVVLDRVVLNNHHNILVVSVAFRRRSIVLAWVALPHRGKSDAVTQQALLTTACRLLPEGVRVTVHGDSEFGSMELYTWLIDQGMHAQLGIASSTYVYADADDATSGQTLRDAVGDRTDVVYQTGVFVTQARVGPVNLYSWWAKDDDGNPILRTVLTNLPATPTTRRRGRKRMWIETVFRDWQSGGFHLDASGIPDRERFAQLLIVVCLAYLWLISLGRWVVKRGYRRLIDDGAARRWQYSLFQLGVGWIKHLHSYNLPPPVILYLYV
jgi:hypothetical protein